jgi:hypothetical protein
MPFLYGSLPGRIPSAKRHVVLLQPSPLGRELTEMWWYRGGRYGPNDRRCEVGGGLIPFKQQYGTFSGEVEP